jgi:hypothetical protein
MLELVCYGLAVVFLFIASFSKVDAQTPPGVSFGWLGLTAMVFPLLVHAIERVG